MIGKGFNPFYERAARYVHLPACEEECPFSSWEDSKMYTTGSIENSQSMVK